MGNKKKNPKHSYFYHDFVWSDQCGPYKIWTFSDKISICPRCKSTLMHTDCYIPTINDDRKLRMPGYYCWFCKRIYVNQGYEEMIVDKLKDNIAAKEFTLNGKSFFQHSKRKENNRLLAVKDKIFSKYPDTQVLIIIKYWDEIEKAVRIINEPQKEDPKNNVFSYKSDMGREYLAAAFATEKNHCGKDSYGDFSVTRYFLPKNNESYNPILTEINIKKGGGFYSLDTRTYVDVLLYSPFTGRYEIMKASRFGSDCYTDIRNYRDFVHKFGNPGIIPFFKNTEKNTYGRSVFDNFNQESVIHSYGYNVSQADNHSDQYRQTLLAEIVDLQILTTIDVIKFLEFDLKSQESNRHYVAADKIKRDLKFIKSYKVNPDRFIIAKKY